MRVTSVELHPADSSDACILSFRDPARLNPYNVVAIIGLDADEIVPRFYGTPGSSNFWNLSLEKRDVVIRIQLNPRYNLDETPSTLRDDLYKLISSSRTGSLQIRFLNGVTTVAAVSGFVTKFEAPHTNKNPEVQITLKCDEPMLKAMAPVDVDTVGFNPAFINIVDALSTAPHGFKFEIGITIDVDSFTIQDEDEPTWNFSIVPVGGFLVDDVIYYSSELNNKYIFMLRDPDIIHLADVVVPGSVWPILFPGDNHFVCADPIRLVWNAVSHYPTYWGV